MCIRDRIYNIGGHNEIRNIDIVKMICKYLKKSEGLITFVEDRKGHDLRYGIDSSKIETELGWKAETRFQDGLEQTISWYLEHRTWWKAIVCGEYQNYYEQMYTNR